MTLQKLEEMLLAMAYSGENIQAAENAFNEVYKEYSKFLTAVVRRSTLQMGIHDGELVHDIVEEVFLKLYRDPFAFQIPDLAENDKYFKAWLSKVSRNELLRILRSSCKSVMLSLPDENEPAFEESEQVPEQMGINRAHLERALSTLHDRDREILLALYSYHEAGKNTPSEVLNSLCQLYSTTKDNIRQIKRRSEKKIIEYFSKNTSLKPV